MPKLPDRPIFEVWHDRSGLIFLGHKPLFPGRHYDHVANVICNRREDVFRLTNTIDWHWSNNEGVEYLLTILTRSTSVGDVIVYKTTGQAWRVACMGFESILLGQNQELSPKSTEKAGF